MSCADVVTNAFFTLNNQLSDDVFRRSCRLEPIIELMMPTRGTYPLGMGFTITNLTTARNFPLTPVASRRTIAPSTGADSGGLDACLPPTITTKHGSIRYTATPVHLAVNTPEFCADDLKFDWQFEKQAANTTKQLTDVTSWVWAQWFKNDYHSLAGHNLTQLIAGPFDNASNGYSTTNPPTSYLSMGTLSQIYNQLYREGGDQPLGTNMDDESPVFGLILGKEASDLLFRNDSTLEQALRFGWMGARDESPVLPSGLPRKRRIFGGYMHFIDPYPRRFNQAGNGAAYVEVPPWVEVAADTGVKQVLNDAYRIANYEEVVVFHPSMYRSLGIPGITNPAPGWKYDPTRDLGEFSIRNIPDKDCNPDGNKLFFRAIFRDAAEPLNPDLGYTILIKNCGYQAGGGVCAPNSSSASA